MDMKDTNSWKDVLEEEMDALKKNNTLDLVPLHNGWKPIGYK